MKRTFVIVLFLAVLFLVLFPLNVNAATTTPTVTLDKTVVNPGQTITITFNFTQPMGAYEFDLDFDDALLDYTSSTGLSSVNVVGGDHVIGEFHDITGGSNPSSSMSVTFTAKSVTASNPTNFSTTFTGLANFDASITFDDITTPIVKYFVVEPAYGAYTIAISQPSNIVANQETPIDVTISSTQGKPYDHLRLVATVTTPSGATMKLMGTNSVGAESDVILSGWGDPTTGFALGGAAVNELYKFRGIFSENGKYTLTLNLIDRDNSDAVIATKTVTFTVGPVKLPKTGSDLYLYSGVSLIGLVSAYAVINRKK